MAESCDQTATHTLDSKTPRLLIRQVLHTLKHGCYGTMITGRSITLGQEGTLASQVHIPQLFGSGGSLLQSENSQNVDGRFDVPNQESWRFQRISVAPISSLLVPPSLRQYHRPLLFDSSGPGYIFYLRVSSLCSMSDVLGFGTQQHHLAQSTTPRTVTRPGTSEHPFTRMGALEDETTVLLSQRIVIL